MLHPAETAHMPTDSPNESTHVPKWSQRFKIFPSQTRESRPPSRPPAVGLRVWKLRVIFAVEKHFFYLDEVSCQVNDKLLQGRGGSLISGPTPGNTGYFLGT